ncbi:DUF692 domain-containing protein [Parasphingopyxis algicola]|uniref:MNIO family bufferin maturase n=1 Tax=Parasphingopyxis algicola TaxID=2026624 RepID=UPI0015A482E3|nr:DUF692 domain-containing protein [Parasphingopyxis algicola]QLC24734.1 DUF692 domain-containing protein [Parasphingopyxis algicola]
MNASAGISFKPQHFDAALSTAADGLWFEVHAENYMIESGPRRAMLEQLRAAWPLSIHGVGLSLAGDAPPDAEHLTKLRDLVTAFEPFLVSEHLAWSRFGDTCFPDLLPFPRSAEALDRITANINIVQDALGRAILIENPSLYMALDGHEMEETEFLNTLAYRTGCGLLVDVNNVHVSANNMDFDPRAYLATIDHAAIGEIHLAGHGVDPALGDALLIDSHDAPVAEAVWELYRDLIAEIGPRPTLIERDGNVPEFEALIAERDRAAAILAHQREPVHA